MAQKGRALAGNENSRFLKFGHYFCPQANLIRLHTILQIQNGSGLEKTKIDQVLDWLKIREFKKTENVLPM